jgi:Ni/Co efflux regulator RcnB
MKREQAMKLWTAILAICTVVLLGCGQKPSSESWSERPQESRHAQPDEAAAGANRPADRPVDRYDLSRDEERGGHTLRKHAGLTDDELRQRLERERDISAASTWTDRATAEQTVSAALRAERRKIENWQRRGVRRPNLVLHFEAGRVLGRSLVRGATQPVPCTEAVIVLRADGEGLYVLTAYPEAR